MRVFSRSALFFIVLVVVVGTGAAAFGQSTNQNFPTPVTSNEISGTIKARDVGDARLTSYFYQFDAEQGDVFINVVARNFAGDIDIFTINGLRPLTKMVVYSDFGENETGRVIYLRKPEKMILRIQGRTPGDDPATFRIKFAGSFVASTMTEPVAEPALPTVTERNESGVRVNSVGTIVHVTPKPTPAPVETASIDDSQRHQEDSEGEKSDAAGETKGDDKSAKSSDIREKRLEVVVTDPTSEKTGTKAAAAPTARRRTRGRAAVKKVPPAQTSASTPSDDAVETPPVRKTPAATRRGRAAASAASAEKVPDPLENVNLIILFKDGTTIERRMSEVFRFSVDKGQLTVISKDGRIGRYSILDVAKVTIQ